jgi:hypothetical protein
MKRIACIADIVIDRKAIVARFGSGESQR